MLLDPFKEKPTCQRHSYRRKASALAALCCRLKKDHRFARLWSFESNAPQKLEVLSGQAMVIESHELIADHSAGLISAARLHTPCVHRRLGSRDKRRWWPDAERTGVRNPRSDASWRTTNRRMAARCRLCRNRVKRYCAPRVGELVHFDGSNLWRSAGITFPRFVAKQKKQFF